MISRRSIFKALPSALALAILPKSWRAEAAEPMRPVSLETLMTNRDSVLAVIGEPGPEIIRYPTFKVCYAIEPPFWTSRVFTDGVDGTTEVPNATSFSFTIKSVDDSWMKNWLTTE